MNDAFRNKAGYFSPTEGIAISHIEKEENRVSEQKRLDEIKNRKKIYVVSKYRGNTEVNTYRACKFCRYVISKGCIPVASHLLYPQFLEDRIPEQRELGCQFGLALLSVCDEVWVFNTDRELSDGMRAEIREARLTGKPVKYHDIRELKI